ncbi:hypothetical protein AYI70_g8012 [Smittium culicis]|uniref:Uncharacterized protein n=1 Tax=Smittium culicis TaxID=133412 RepID=A0A1R1XHW8_9FUNG|nr:hypothetical protein AYI70_g8012 [Smittium culicis]
MKASFSRDHSVNPYCTVTVKGIKPQPYRVVKGFLIDSRIWIENVANIQFVGDKTVFLVEKYIDALSYI